LKGKVKGFLPEKGYGFIKGDDRKDYFFHRNDLQNPNDERQIYDEVFVSFTQAVTPKGYKAKQVELINADAVDIYIYPDKFLYFKTSTVRGWEIVEASSLRVIGTSRQSPQAAREITLKRARNLGASGMIQLEYIKTRGSEPGTGRGIYYFTIHNYVGRPMTLAKKNASSSLPRSHFLGLDTKVRGEKTKLQAMIEESKAQAKKKWLNLAPVALIGGLIISPLFFVLILAGRFFIHSEEYDYWLVP